MGDLEARLAWAESMSAEVGAFLRAEAGRHVTASAKPGKGIVTALDRRAEGMIAGSLAAVFPGDGLQAEEGTRRDARSAWRWVVDPLDGTTNFVAGLPMYAVSLACLDDRGAALGVVHAPALGETFTAVRGRPAPPAAGGAGDLSAAVFIVNKAYAPAARLWAVAGDLMGTVRAFRTLGCVSLDLALVSAGRVDGLVLLPADPWDVAAGLLMAAEAGLRTGALDGSASPDGRRGILATRPGLFEAAAARLDPAALAG